MTVWYRAELAQASSVAIPNVYLKEDYALWARMIQEGARCQNLPEVLVTAATGEDLYRRRGGGRYAAAEFNCRYIFTMLA